MQRGTPLKYEFLKGLSEIPPDELELFLIDHNICPECGTSRYVEERDSELVCTNCGLVLREIFSPEQKVPIKETRSPTCSLAFDKSLGSHLPKKYLNKILAQAPAGEQDLPIRAIHIRTLNHVEFPQLRKALEYGSKLTREFVGNPSDHNDPSDPVTVFAESLGRNIRHVVTESMQRSRGSVMIKRLVNAIFLYTYRKHFGMNGLFKVYDNLGLDREVWDYVNYLMEEMPKLPTKIEYLRKSYSGELCL